MSLNNYRKRHSNWHTWYIYVNMYQVCVRMYTVYSKKYAHGFCFAVLCCGYTLTDFPISIRLTSLALWQSNDCPSASKATLMNMDKYFMWIHYERLHNHNKAKHNKTVCIFLGIYCRCACGWVGNKWCLTSGLLKMKDKIRPQCKGLCAALVNVNVFFPSCWKVTIRGIHRAFPSMPNMLKCPLAGNINSCPLI